MQYSDGSDFGLVGYLGEVRQDTDGQLYQLGEIVDELGNVELGWLAFGEADYDSPQLGEVREGSDGNLYQYTETVDGLGNIGFAWASLIPLAAQALPGIARGISSLFKGRRSRRTRRTGRSPVEAGLQQMLPQIARMVTEQLSRQDGGSGLGEDDLLYGLDEDQELYGLNEDPELFGLDDTPEDDLGMSDEELGEDDLYLGDEGATSEFQGLDEAVPYAESGLQGYLQEQPGGRLNGYVKGAPSASPSFPSGPATPDMWKPLWG